MALLAPVDLKGIELVTDSRFLLAVSLVVGYAGRSILVRTQGRTPAMPAERDQYTD